MYLFLAREYRSTPSMAMTEPAAPCAVIFVPNTITEVRMITTRFTVLPSACVTGCNVTAKSTVDMNYLSVAEKQGAEIYVQAEVLGIEKSAQGRIGGVRTSRGDIATDVCAICCGDRWSRIAR